MVPDGLGGRDGTKVALANGRRVGFETSCVVGGPGGESGTSPGAGTRTSTTMTTERAERSGLVFFLLVFVVVQVGPDPSSSWLEV